MDYEQRYKDALDEAKAIHKSIRKDLKPIIEQIFPELKESEDERIRKELINFIKNKLENPCFPTPSKNILANWITWLEKQDEQESVDKVEPKFNLYDWVVTDKGDVVQIGAVNNGYYTIHNGMDFNMFYVDKFWHLWTIEDAKDGDVLYHSDSASNGIFIFKEIRNDGKVLCYCDYDSEDHFCLGEHHTCCWMNDKYIRPATKEQYDILFEKMKLEGYRWDEDKKELIRFERFVRRTESAFDFKEDENGVIKFVRKES